MNKRQTRLICTKDNLDISEPAMRARHVSMCDDYTPETKNPNSKVKRLCIYCSKCRMVTDE